MKKLALLLLLFSFSFVNSQEPQSYAYYPQEPELAEYISKMPWQHYGNFFVKDLGWFWVDSAHDCVKDTIKQGKIWETYILEVMNRYIKKGDHVLDIGAHMGTISLAMSNLVGPTGMVYAFEGERQFFRELLENVKLNRRPNIIPHLCWVSNEDKEIVIHHYYGPEYSPVHSVDDKPWHLQVHSLDSFNFDKIALMKIDVECTEDNVLLGAREIIMQSRPIIVIEIMGGFGWNVTPEIRSRIDHTISILNQMNYTVSKIHIDDYLAIPNERL